MHGVLPPVPTLAARSGTDLVRDDFGTAALLLAVAGWLVYLLARHPWDRRSKKGGRGGGVPDRLELPDDPPAVAHAVHRGGEVGSTLLGVVVLDLARQGCLEVVEQVRPGVLADTREWVCRRRESPRGDLRPYENAVYTRLFATGNEVGPSDLAAWAQENRQQARVFLDRLRRYLMGELRGRGYVERARRTPLIVNLVAAGVVAVVGLAALGSGAVLGLAAVGSAVGQGSRTRTLRRHTVVGSDRGRRWSDAARALAGVTELEEAPANDRAGWERCLVYAVALGVGDEFVAGMAERSPKATKGKEFASWYAAADPEARFAHLPRLAEEFGQALTRAAEAARPESFPAVSVPSATRGSAGGPG